MGLSIFQFNTIIILKRPVTRDFQCFGGMLAMSFLVTCPVSSASISLSPDFKTIRKEGTGGSLSVIFLHGWRKEMPVFFIFILRLL